jgi:hypothetical protein
MEKYSKDIMFANCLCGKVEFKASGKPVITTACHCADCFKGSHLLETLPNAPPILNSFGGTPHILYRKDRVEYLKGTEFFKNIQVEDDSPKRVYASCCNSYLFMDLPSPMQWVPIHRNRFQGDVPPIEMRINAKFKTQESIPNDVPVYSSVPFKFVLKLLGTVPAMLFKR